MNKFFSNKNIGPWLKSSAFLAGFTAFLLGIKTTTFGDMVKPIFFSLLCWMYLLRGMLKE